MASSNKTIFWFEYFIKFRVKMNFKYLKLVNKMPILGPNIFIDLMLLQNIDI